MKTLGNIKRKCELHIHRQSGAGFTLLELLITIAITGILTAMIFSNFSKERDRNNLKAAVRQIQVDLQAMQTNAQGGVAQGGVVPNGYGLVVESENAGSYKLFADMAGIASVYDDSTQDVLLQPRTLPGINNDITILKWAPPSPAGSIFLNIVFKKPNGEAVITTDKIAVPPTTQATETLYVRSAKLDTCYAITVTANVGTVSQRQLASCT